MGKRTQTLDRGTVLLPILIFSFYWPVWNMAFSLQLCLEGLFTVDVENGVLRVLFNEAENWGLVRHLFLKLDINVLVLLLSCALGPPTHLSILVRASLRCSVKGVVRSIVRDIQFLGYFSHEIAFISQNKNRLTSFRRKLLFLRHFEPVIEPTNADAPDTQLV